MTREKPSSSLTNGSSARAPRSGSTRATRNRSSSSRSTRKTRQRALEEGPLPFLFNMKASEAEARYLMTLVSEDKDFYVISVAPRLRVDQEAFSKAFLKLNGKTFLPGSDLPRVA